jgi:hypothetical protein
MALAGLTALSVAGNRYSPFYRGFSFPGKLFFVLTGGIAVSLISAENEMVNTYYRIKQVQSMNTVAAQTKTPKPLSVSEWIAKYQMPIACSFDSSLLILILIMFI